MDALEKKRKYQREWKQRWREQNPGADLAYQRAYRAANPEKSKQYSASNYRKTKADPVRFAHLRETKLAYAKAHPTKLTVEKKREYNQRAYYKDREKILAQKKAIYIPRNNRRVGLDIERAKASRKAWRAENKERVRRTNRAYYDRVQADPILRTSRDLLAAAWKEANRERIREAGRKWSRTHPLERQLKFRRRKARMKGASGHFSSLQWIARYEYYGGCCAYCGTGVGVKTGTIDHIIPIASGGTNLQILLLLVCHAIVEKARSVGFHVRSGKERRANECPQFTSEPRR